MFTQTKDKHLYIMASLAGLLCLIAWWALFAYSPMPMSGLQAWQALVGFNPQDIAQVIVREVRLPRVLQAALVGASLASAGTLMQGLTRNPLASPSLFGVNAGAALGMALVATVFSSTVATHSILTLVSTPVAAISGSLIAWCLVMLLGGAWKVGSERGQLILAGIAISALCSALTKASVILYEEQAASVMAWLAGSFAHVQWQTWQTSWPPLGIALVLSILLAPKINLLVIGDERAQSLGLNLTWLRILIGITVLILVGISVSSVGGIAFVGLITPHIARYLVGHDHKILLPTVMMIGAILTLLADIICRVIIFPTETPAGAILALIGAPCFLYLARKKS